MDIAVILPCHNEESAIAKVVEDFRLALPNARIYVYDNASTDNTAKVARAAGAIVGKEQQAGKGNVIRRMFADVEADVYLMADGDGTYDPSVAPKMIETLVDGNLDMVVGSRVPVNSDEAYRRGHVLGNRLLTGLVVLIFGRGVTDMLSGYRAFSKRFVKTFPTTSRNFEIETEMTIHALQMSLPMAEISAPYFKRIEGSQSKLSTYKDGFRILRFIALMMKEIKPLIFFSLLASLLAFLSLAFFVPVMEEYLSTGLVPRLPTAILSLGLMLAAMILLVCGLFLDSIARLRLEQKRLAYLTFPSPLNKSRSSS